MKIKPSKNMLYTIKAKVFSTKLGRDFSRTVHTTVIGNNKEIIRVINTFLNLILTSYIYSINKQYF